MAINLCPNFQAFQNKAATSLAKKPGTTKTLLYHHKLSVHYHFCTELTLELKLNTLELCQQGCNTPLPPDLGGLGLVGFIIHGRGYIPQIMMPLLTSQGLTVALRWNSKISARWVRAPGSYKNEPPLRFNCATPLKSHSSVHKSLKCAYLTVLCCIIAIYLLSYSLEPTRRS